jgi:hypothetical protein
MVGEGVENGKRPKAEGLIRVDVGGRMRRIKQGDEDEVGVVRGGGGGSGGDDAGG